MTQRRLTLLLVAICWLSGVLPANSGALDGTVLLERILPLDLGGDMADSIQAVRGDPEGRVLVAGRTSTGIGTWTMFVARFLHGGQIDLSFGNAGIVTNPFGVSFNSKVAALELLPDGKILTGGTVEPGGGAASFIVGRLTSSGQPDNSFGVWGYSQFNFGGAASDHLEDLVVDQSDRIVVVGTADSDQTDSEFAIARLNPDGFFDTSFSGDGLAVHGVDFSGARPDLARSVAIDGVGRIVVAGSSWHRNLSNVWNYDFALMRLESDGDLDPGFGSAGRQVYPYDFGGTLNDNAFAVTLDPLGRIVVAGEVAEGPGVGEKSWAVLRVDGTGVAPGVLPDETFGNDGWMTGTFVCGGVASCGIRDSASAISIRSDGRIILAGTGFDLGFQLFGAARLTGDGALDPSFGGLSGAILWDVVWGPGAGNDRAFALAIEPDGNLLVAGATEYNGFDTDLAWLRLANGDVFADGFETGDTSAWSTP